MQPKRYEPHVDGLRAIAVVAICLFHLKMGVLAGGFVGVDVFFVISGYLITSKIVNDLGAGQFSFLDFYLGRVRRIAPALLATVGATFLVGLVIFSPVALQAFSASSIATLLSVSNIYFWLTSGYFDAAAETKPLLHTWSLGVEEQFYVLWPVFLVALNRFERTRTAICVIVVAAGTFAAERYVRTDASAAYFLLPFRVPEFAIGSLLALTGHGVVVKSRAAADLGFIAGVVAVVVVALGFHENTRFPGLSALVPSLGAAGIIYFGGHSRFGKIIDNGFAVAIGKRSYSIYLVHWPVIVFSKYYLMRDMSLAEKAESVVVIGLLSMFSYRFIEAPFRKQRAKSVAIPRAALVTFFVAGTFILLLPSIVVWRQGGWGWRSGELGEQFSSIDNPKDFHTAYYGGRDCTVPRCETNPGAPKRVYLLGDSLARALAYGAGEEFKDVNFIVYGPSTCMFFSQEYTSATNDENGICVKARHLAFSEIKKQPAPIVVQQSWVGRMRKPIFKDAEPSIIADTGSVTKYASFAANELVKLKQSIGGLPVVLIGSPPMNDLPISPYDCLTRPFRPTDRCEFSRISSSELAVNKGINDALQAGLSSELKLINPFDYLCDGKVCRNTDSAGLPTYSDNGHFSIWGSLEFVSLIRRELAKSLDLQDDRLADANR